MSIPYKTMRCTVIYPLRNMFEVAPLEAPGGLNQGRAIKVDLGNLADTAALGAHFGKD